MEPLLGEIRPFAFSFNPSNWLVCNGQLLPIQQYSALYSILGIAYGGNGTTNFALPNIQGSVANGAGQMPGGQNYTVGEAGGSTGVTLTTDTMPAHNHGFNGATTTAANDILTVPVNGSYISNSFAKANPGATTGVLGRSFAPATPAPNGILNPASIGLSGGNQPHNNMMPYVAITYCIAIAGTFPTRP
jgi:microcystin-dependent protein